jgi:hypothetical protein
MVEAVASIKRSRLVTNGRPLWALKIENFNGRLQPATATSYGFPPPSPRLAM